MRRVAIVAGCAAVLVAMSVGGTNAAAESDNPHSSDVRVNSGSPRTQFPRNKQNEPAVAVAIDSHDPSVLVSGSNDEIDNSPCNGSDCSFTPGVTDNGVYFSFNSGKSWTQPTYTGWSARTGTAQVGPIGTAPWYYEAGMVGDGDPGLAFGPKPGPHGFSWSNGSRLYYSSLASNFPGSTAITEQEAIAVDRTDDVRAAAAGNKNAWMRPVIASANVDPSLFSDKSEIWADNASSSPNFGNAYLCWTSFGTSTAPIVFSRSTDGGSHWTAPLTVFTPDPSSFGSTSCTMRTDSHGVIYLMWEQQNTVSAAQDMLARSFDGGQTFETPRAVSTVTEVGALDPAHVNNGDPRFTFDGVAGARTFSGLQIDIANGAPSGHDATNQMVMTWSDGRNGLNHEQALLQSSRDRGVTWTGPVAIQQGADRPDFPAIAIAPNGKTVYLTYDAFLAPWRTTTSTARPMQGVVRTATVTDNGRIGQFQTVHRGKVGDARGSSENNLCCEFLGDYNFVSASRDFGAAVWNDVRDAAVCPTMNTYRQKFAAGTTPNPKPSPASDCPATFGNSDIYGGTYKPNGEGQG